MVQINTTHVSLNTQICLYENITKISSLNNKISNKMFIPKRNNIFANTVAAGFGGIRGIIIKNNNILNNLLKIWKIKFRQASLNYRN